MGVKYLRTFMLASGRRFLMIAAIALYGATTFGGAALHALPGAAHAGSDAPAADGPGGGSNHDCPVCHFFAQAQVAVDLTGVPIPLEFVACDEVRPTRRPPTSIDPSPSPRAPPVR